MSSASCRAASARFAAIRQAGLRADYFVNSEPTDLQAMTMHAAAFTFDHRTARASPATCRSAKQAVDAIMAACELIPGLTR
jgi:acetylornithine deacetylase